MDKTYAIPQAQDYLPGTSSTRHLMQIVASEVTTQAHTHGYALFTKMGPANIYSKVIQAAQKKGWLVTEVSCGKLVLTFFAPDKKEDLIILRYHSPKLPLIEGEFEESLIRVLRVWGFHLKEESEEYLCFARVEFPRQPAAGEEFIAALDLFPEAEEFAKDKIQNGWLHALSLHLREDAEKDGYCTHWFETVYGDGPADLQAAFKLFEEAGWRLTKVFKDDWLDFIVFTPREMTKLSLAPAIASGRGLNEEEKDRLIHALASQGFRLTEGSHAYLTFINA